MNPQKLTAFLLIAIAPSLLSKEIKRYCFGEWCEKIGYSEAVAVGDTLYLSGIIGEGEDMEASLAMAFGRLEWILNHFGLDHSYILKEKIYTNNKDALRKSTHIRKAYYQGHFPAAIWIEAESHRTISWLEMEIVVHIPDGHELPENEQSQPVTP